MSIIYRHGRSEEYLPLHTSHSVDDIYQYAANAEGLSRNQFYLTFNGKYIQSDDIVTCPCDVRLHLRLPGGKGGFGSMLRAIGARIEKTTNHEACRDLSGRRMRDVNNEKQIAEWVSSKDSQEEERKQKRIAKLEKIINPKHNYEDRGYTSSLQDNADKINDALKSALSKRDKRLDSKRKLRDNSDDDPGNQKKNRMWIGVDYDDDSEDSDSDCSEDIVSVGDQPCSSKSCIKDTPRSYNNTDNEEGGDTEDDDFNTGDLDKPTQDAKINITAVEKIVNTDFDSINANIASSTPDIAISIANVDSSTAIISNVDSSTPDIATIIANVDSCIPDIASSTVANITSSVAAFGSNTKNITDKTNNDSENNSPTNSGASSKSESTIENKPIDLNEYSSAQHLEEVGLDRLKSALMAIGFKCGGTLQERAQRLFITKNTPLDQLDPSLFSKGSKGKMKKKK